MAITFWCLLVCWWRSRSRISPCPSSGAPARRREGGRWNGGRPWRWRSWGFSGKSPSGWWWVSHPPGAAAKALLASCQMSSRQNSRPEMADTTRPDPHHRQADRTVTRNEYGQWSLTKCCLLSLSQKALYPRIKQAIPRPKSVLFQL